MGYATSQQLARYHQLYQNIEVTFSKEVIRTTGLIPQQVFLKSLGGQWPCVINSTSLVGAKIIAGIKSGVYEKIQQGVASVSLRFSFLNMEKNEPFSFFVASKVTGMTQYAGSPDLILINLAFTQRAPDDLIERLGTLLEANVNSTKRREERILITPDSLRKLGIAQKETIVFIQGIPRRCILRDVSFSGAKVIMVGIAAFLDQKEVVLRIDFEDPRNAVGIKGKIVRTEDVEGRRDLVALAIRYEEGEVPMAYKMHINTFISQLRKNADDDRDDESAAKPAAKPAAAKAAPAGAAAPAKDESPAKDEPPSEGDKDAEDAKPAEDTTETAEAKDAAKTEASPQSKEAPAAEK